CFPYDRVFCCVLLHVSFLLQTNRLEESPISLGRFLPAVRNQSLLTFCHVSQAANRSHDHARRFERPFCVMVGRHGPLASPSNGDRPRRPYETVNRLKYPTLNGRSSRNCRNKAALSVLETP